MIYLEEKVELCSFDKVLSIVRNHIACFENEEKMHEHCAAVAFGLEEKGLAFNGRNVSRYFDYSTRILTDDEVKFVFGAPSRAHIGKFFK